MVHSGLKISREISGGPAVIRGDSGLELVSRDRSGLDLTELTVLIVLTERRR